MASKFRRTTGIAVPLSLAIVLGIKAQDQGTVTVPVKSSYQFPVAEEDFPSFFKRISADKPEVRNRQMNVFNERYDLSDRPDPNAQMSRGKPVQAGVRVKLPAVSHQCCNSAGDRSRSPASWSRDRLLQRAPYLGPATATSSPCPLRACRRRPRSGPLPLDLLSPLLLPSRQSAQPCLPRQVYRRTQDRLSCRRTPVPRTSLTACETARLRLLAAGTVPSRLGCLRQTAFRRPRTCAVLSRCLHASRRHLQPQVGCSLRGQRNLSLARLRSRQQEAADDSTRR